MFDAGPLISKGRDFVETHSARVLEFASLEATARGRSSVLAFCRFFICGARVCVFLIRGEKQ